MKTHKVSESGMEESYFYKLTKDFWICFGKQYFVYGYFNKLSRKDYVQQVAPY